MSPFEISILLHYHTRLGDFRNGDFSAPIVRPTLDAFVDGGLLRYEDNGVQLYHATEATRVYCEALCAIPAPVQTWAIPAEDRYTLTEAGYRAVMQQGAKLNGGVKAGEESNG